MGTALLVALVLSLQGQAAPPTTFDQAVAWQHLLKQVEFGPRVPGSRRHVDCRDWIKAEMDKSCDNVRLQPFRHKWSQSASPVQMWNILGEQNWAQAKIRIVLLTHWDTRPYASEETELGKARQPILGANDGASGVAVLLELMRALKGKLGEVGILYLMTDGEDLGPGLDEMFLGAKHFAANLPAEKPEYGILLDMIGDKNLQVPMERNSFEKAETLVRGFYNHARGNGFGREFPYMLGEVIFDDHLALIDAGIPTMDLIDFTYDPWHTLADTPDKCSAESLGKVGKMLESWLLKKPAFTLRKGY